MNDHGRVRISFGLACALLAARALGARAVRGILLPSSPVPRQTSAPAPAPAPPPPGRRRAAAAGRQQAAPPPPPDPEPSAVPTTPGERLTYYRGQCWMKFENGKADRDLEKRAKLVEKCVEDRMKE